MFPWKASGGMVNRYNFPTYAVESGMPHSRVRGSLPVRVSAASRAWNLRAWPWTWATHTVTTTNTVIHLVSNSISIVTRIDCLTNNTSLTQYSHSKKFKQSKSDKSQNFISSLFNIQQQLSTAAVSVAQWREGINCCRIHKQQAAATYMGAV